MTLEAFLKRSRMAVFAVFTSGLAGLAPIASAATAAGGNYHSVVIDGSASVWTWGNNTYGQLGNGTTVTSTLPVRLNGLTGVVQVAAGAYHTLALKQDGSVWAWGHNGYGQVGDGTTTQRNAPVQVTGLSGIGQIAAGDNHSVAWKADGSVWTWGLNGSGQLGDGTTTSRSAPVQVTGLIGVLAIGAGGSHTLAAKADGTAWSWGSNANGQLGDGTTVQKSSPVQVPGLSGIASVVGGTAFSVALKSDGTAWSWGSNLYGQLGDGTATQQVLPVRVAYLFGWTRLSDGQYHVLAVRNDAAVWGWGADFYGELGDGELIPALAPTLAPGFSGAVEVAAARYETSIVVTGDGTIWAWGYNAYGEVGDGTTIHRLNPVKVTEAGYAWKTGTPVPSVLTGVYSSNQTVSLSCATAGATIRYTTDGTDPVTTSPAYTAPLSITSTSTLKAKAWSASLAPSNVQAATYTMKVATPTFSPAGGPYTSSQTVTLSTTTTGATIRYTTDGTQPTSSSAPYTAPLPIATTTTLKAAGFKDGWTSSGVATAVYAMNFGTLAAPGMSPGAGTSVGSATVTLSAPGGATIRYTTDGTDPTATSPVYTTPLVLAATTTLKAKAFRVDWTSSTTTSNVYTIQVAAPSLSRPSGQYPAGQTVSLTCATPGATIYYSLDGTDPTQSYPYVASGGTILVGNYTIKAKAWATGLTPSAITSAAYTMTGVAGGMVAAGSAHSLTLKTNGSVWSWGSNGYGQLGDGTTTQRATPTAVGSLTGVVAIAAGGYHSLAVTSSGSVWAWGYNYYGQLGDGSTTQRTTPVQVSGLSGVIAVAAGQYHSLALKSDGTVWAWGYNYYGQLGDGSNTQRTTPVQVASLSGATLVAAGANHCLARKSDGTLWAWGYNGNGQLGDNTVVSKNSPVQVSGLASVAAAGGGAYDSLSAKTDGTAWAWGYNNGSWIPVARSGLTGATAMKAGVYHFVALESNWYVWAWGQNGYGQLGNGTTTASSTPVWVSGLPQIISIGSGDNHNLALGQDGSVWAWGANGSGQVGDGTTANRTAPVKVAEAGFAWKAGTPVFSPAGGAYTSSQSVAITTATAGATIRYTLDGSTPTSGSPLYSVPVSVTATTTIKAKAMKAGLADSSVEVGVYSLKVATPTLSPMGGSFSTSQNPIIACTVAGATIRYTTNGLDPTTSDPTIASGGTVAVTRTTVLKARAWLAGWTTSDVATATFTLKAATPSLSPGGGVFTTAPTITVSAATSGSIIRYTTSGLEPTEVDPVVASGGTVNVGLSATLKAKAFISGWTASDTVSATYVLNLAAAASPTFAPAAGTYTAAQAVTLASATPGVIIRYTLDGADPTPWSPIFAGPIPIPGTRTVKAVAYAPDRAPSSVASGTYQINLGAVDTPTLSVASGFYVTSRTATVSCGTAGATIRYTTNGTDPTVNDPTIASGGTLLVDRAMIVKAAAWKSGLPQSAVARRDYVVTGMVAAGGSSTLGLKSDGSVWAWGHNGYGQLGDGTTTVRTTPVQVTGLTGVIAIAEGSAHSLAVKTDGSVWAWGYNVFGQLGDGTTIQRTAPVQVTGLTSVVAIAAGQYHSLAVKSDGSVWAWGYNGYGQLGDGTTTQRNAPVQLTGLTGVVAVAAGADHSLALKSDGSVKAWGSNGYGQLGDGTITQRLVPVSVSNLTGASRVAAGNSFSVALRTKGLSSGAVWAWGVNSAGQLGDGTTLSRSSPVESSSSVMTLAAGDRHVVAPALDGHTLAWGANDTAQLGIPGSTARTFPSPVTDLGEILQVAAGVGHSVTTRADGSILGWGANNSGQLGTGTQAPTQTRAAKISTLVLASNGWMTQDPDQDGLTNAAEYRLGSDPLNPDTNQDGLKDGVAAGNDATRADADGDGLLNAKELQIGTNPLVADTDGDGALDGADCAPLDPSRWQCTPNPSDTTPPVIALSEPSTAVLVP